MNRSHVTGIHTVAIPTADQARAFEFYVGVLGFETRRDAELGAGMRWIELAPPGSATTVAPMTSPDPATGVDTGIRLVSDDVEATHAHLLTNGTDVDPDIMRWDGAPPMFTFRDPDGNTLVVVGV